MTNANESRRKRWLLTIVVVLVAIGVGLAVRGSGQTRAASAVAETRVAGARTCAFDNAGRNIGCLELVGDCNINVYGNARWQFAHEGFMGPADANARLLRPGVWQIRTWPHPSVIGYATATNTAQTRWTITNPQRWFVANARGSEGPGIAMVLLHWGDTCLAGGAPAPASRAFSVYRDASIKSPYGITAGSDGALWFTNSPRRGRGSIGRITTNGTVSGYRDKRIGRPMGITAGPDGALWFTNSDRNSIGRITTRGTVSIYRRRGINGPYGITAGPDGALWFTNHDSIGRITTRGAVRIYKHPSISIPRHITTGPDGALWFTNWRITTIGQITTTIGRITTEGRVSAYKDSRIAGPEGITAGPDGALWFTNAPPRKGLDSIGRITTTGKVTLYRDARIKGPEGITAGPDGALWFTNWDGTIGRITPNAASFYEDTRIDPQQITAGPDRALWFTNSSPDSIGHFRIPPRS